MRLRDRKILRMTRIDISIAAPERKRTQRSRDESKRENEEGSEEVRPRDRLGKMLRMTRIDITLDNN